MTEGAARNRAAPCFYCGNLILAKYNFFPSQALPWCNKEHVTQRLGRTILVQRREDRFHEQADFIFPDDPKIKMERANARAGEQRSG